MADVHAGWNAIRSLLTQDSDPEGCGCTPSIQHETLLVDATGCEHGGDPRTTPECRSAIIDTLTERDVESIRIDTPGRQVRLTDQATDLLVAAGRFVEAVGFHDERLADRALTDPMAAGWEAIGRAGPVADAAQSTDLAAFATHQGDYGTALPAYEGPTVSKWLVDPVPPAEGTLRAVRDLDTGATVRRYELPAGPDRYVLEPPEWNLDAGTLSLVEAAYQKLASGTVEGEDRAPARAVRTVLQTEEDDGDWRSISVEPVADVVRKHARGHGLLEDLFADPRLTDVFISAPAVENALRVTVDGEKHVTNIRLTEAGLTGIASRFRRESGRAFSRADPTLDATTTVGERTVRVAGITEPTSDGAAFAFRAQDEDVWTLPRLVENGSISAEAAAVLSVAVERGAAILTAGPRGAGKTTLLATLLWELPPTVRTVIIEDTPELPVQALQEAGRDVQALLASDEDQELSVVEALRTALRLGNGALTLGEVRGEEAAVLYEAMRVGANSEAVLGTIHGDGATAVKERVVTDLGVPASSFGITDLIVTCEVANSGQRRVGTIEEVVGGEEPSFSTLFAQKDGSLEPTGRIDRGSSTVINALAGPEETYADVREQLSRRERLLAAMATRHETSATAVSQSHGRRNP